MYTADNITYILKIQTIRKKNENKPSQTCLTTVNLSTFLCRKIHIWS
jgi:ABC-type proline/glycine betaine transport system ATPase subunit